MSARKPIAPTPPPTVPALMRPTLGALLLSGVASCARPSGDPPTTPPEGHDGVRTAGEDEGEDDVVEQAGGEADDEQPPVPIHAPMAVPADSVSGPQTGDEGVPAPVEPPMVVPMESPEG